MRATASEGALAFLIGGIGSVAILMAGVSLIRQDLMTIGELLAFYALAAQLYGPITRLAHFHGILSATSVALERIGEVLDEPEMLSDNPRVLPVGPAPGALVFDEVTFSYPGRVKPALRKATLRVEPGMTIGILGPSGAGKSTLLALAAQLYEVPKGQGAIRFGNTDIRELGTADVRRAILLVPQNAVLFEGTLRSNLVYARPDASEADVLKAIRVAHLAKLVENLPLGLDTPVGERGVNLSGGQRQRMALARALIANPAMLLLDDCTSALDAATETHILRELAAAYPDQTRIVVSHKLTTIARADLIIVMDDGQIVEQGTHAELAARAGFYTRTRTLQLPKIAVDPSPFDVPAPA
jgi:ABC-type multidrug transport system fused ATPase/permease subunit